MNRRKFVSISSIGFLAIASANIFTARARIKEAAEEYIMTVNGKLYLKDVGFILPHEHIVTDFIGAEKVKQPQYERKDVISKVLPILKDVKQSGVGMLIECTPAYIGRDVNLLQQLSIASRIHLVTNTGYYAAMNFRFLPKHAFVESSRQLSSRWLEEWEYGIEGTGIRPGFIKLGVNEGPLKDVEIKLVEAAALTHLKSGLKVAIHTGNIIAAQQELDILNRNGVGGEALIWIHAQNDKNGETQVKLAKKGVWISLDGVNQTEAAIIQYCASIKRFKQEGLLHKLLISHDDGFAVNRDGSGTVLTTYDNGNVKPYSSVFENLKPVLLKEGLTEVDFQMLTKKNPMEVFKIKKFPFKK